MTSQYFFPIVLALGVAQGIFLGLAILTKPNGNLTTNGLLASLIFTFVLDLADQFATAIGLMDSVPKLKALNWSIDFLYGPLVFLYTTKLIDPHQRKLSRSDLRHLLPFLIAMVVVAVSWMVYSSSQFTTHLAGTGPDGLNLLEWVLGIGSFASMLGYLFTTYNRVSQYQQKIRDRYSAIERISLQWLRILVSVLLSLFVLYVVSMVVQAMLPKAGIMPSYLLFFPMVAAIYAIGFFGLRQSSIFSAQPVSQSQNFSLVERAGDVVQSGIVVDSTQPETAPGKYEKSAISSTESELLITDVRDFMDIERPFLEGDLSLSRLAELVSLSPNNLSQTINEAAGVNFFDFVNQYRVSEAQRLLGDSKWSVLDAGLEAGFNSKSAYYAAFKKYAKQTPRQYRMSAALQADTESP